MLKRTIQIVSGLILGYALLGFFAVPYIIEKIVPQKVSEATKGGVFAVESASFNPFSFHLELNQLTFLTPQKQELLVFKALTLNVDPLAYLWKGGWVIDEIGFVEPHVTIHRNQDGEFNFQWLSELGGDEESDKNTSEPLGLIINRFGLKNGRLNYQDYADGKEYTLAVGPIGFNLDNIDLRDLSSADGKMRLYATINEGGFIDLKAKIDSLSPLILGGSVAFDSGKLYTPWRYFKEKFPIEVADGSAAFGFDYRFNSADVNATELDKLHFEVEKLRIIPKGEQRNLLSLGSLRLKEGRVLPMKKSFQAGALELNGMNVYAQRSKQGKIDWLNYLEEIQKGFPKDENETESAPWSVEVGNIAIENVGLEWRDYAPKEPYLLSWNNLQLHSGAVSSKEGSLLNLSFASDALELTRLRDNGSVVGMSGLGVEGIKIDRAGKFALIDQINILNPRLKLKRLADGTLDLTHYLYSDSAAKSSKGSPWGYRLNEILLNNGEVGMIDEVPSKDVALNLDQLNLSLKGFDNQPEHKNDLLFSTRINNKSTLELKAGITRSALSARGNVALKNFDVSWIDPYVEPSTYASLRRGTLSLNADYHYGASKTALKGKVALQDWVVNDSRDDSVLLGWESIGATPFEYAYPANQLRINELIIDGLYSNVLIDSKKVLNYTTLSKKSSSESNTTQPSSNPFGIDIVKLLLRGSSATFSDLSLPLPFKTYVHDLEGSVLGISTTKDVTTFVKLRGGVDQYGLAKVDGSLNTKAPKKFTDIKVAFDNLELKGYTPYSLEFLGYKIEGGKLYLDLGYKIDEGKLNGANHVVIKQIELGAEKEGGSPWPLRFVIALLEDSDGVIDIDLPIEGDVNNPDFKYGKVVWQVIGNLFTKAVTSPFRLLGSLMGVDSDKLSSIDFEAGSTTLLPPQIEKLDQVTLMLAKRPKLSLNVYGGWDEVNDAKALKTRKLVQAALKRNKDLKISTAQAMSVELLEEMAEDALEKKEFKALKNTLEEKYPEDAAFVRHYSEALIEKLVPLQPLTPQELQILAQQRGQAIRNYLAKTAGYEKRIQIKESEPTKEDKEAIASRLEIVVP